ncbi:ATP-dependent helicase NAM7, partial [Paecilomyces variotii]
GPPGTGKTTVSEGIARYCYQKGHPLLIVCGSNFGLDVIARRITLRFPNSQPPLETSRIYRLGTDFHETSEMQMAPGALNQSSLGSAEFDAAHMELLQLGIQPELLKVIKQSVQDMVSASSDFSLGSRIISRMERAAQLGSNWPQTTNEERDEMTLIWNYFTWQKCLLREGIAFAEPVSASGEADPIRAGAGTDRSEEDVQPLHASFVQQLRRAWTDLQEFYLGHAKIILCTASTASRKSLRGFRPEFVLVEEASQMPESTCLNAISRYISNLKKVILSGDIAQLPPTVTSLHMNEAYSSEKVSLFQRMLQSGVPDVQLAVQYRMHPHIADFVSAEYYEQKLVNNPSYKQGKLSDTFSNYMVQRYHCYAGASFFVSVENSTVFRRRNGTSLFNPEYVSFIGEWVAWFCGLGCPQQYILILSFYSDERRILADLMRKLGFKDVKISSVDASQGDESEIVILSTTR